MQVKKSQDEVEVSYVCWRCTGHTGQHGTFLGIQTEILFFFFLVMTLNRSKPLTDNITADLDF